MKEYQTMQFFTFSNNLTTEFSLSSALSIQRCQRDGELALRWRAARGVNLLQIQIIKIANDDEEEERRGEGISNGFMN